MSSFELARLEDSVNSASRVLNRPVPLSGPEWADKYYKLVSESSGISGDWKTFGYQYGLLHAMADDRISFVAFQKSTRMGYTKMLTCNALRNTAYLHRNVINYQPTDEDSEGYEKDEISPAIEASPDILAKLRVDSAHKKDPLNTISRKTFIGGSVMHNLSGQSPKNYRRRTADLTNGDEIDEFPLNVGRSKDQKQGSAIRLMARALTDSPYPKQIVGSSPTTEGFSLIERQILALKNVAERYLPCPDCGHFQVLRFGGEDVPYGLKWHKGDVSSVKYLCSNSDCGCLFDHQQMMEQDDIGEWRTETQFMDDATGLWYSLDDPLKTVEEEPPGRLGMKLTSFYSRFITWAEIIEAFLEASAKARAGDDADLRTVINHYFGETFKEQLYDQIEPIEFQEDHLYDYKEFDVPGTVRCITAGVDCQKDHVHIDLVGWADGETSYGIKYIRHHGDLDEDSFWDEVEELCTQEFTHENGGRISAKLVCIDSGHKASQVYKFCRRDSIRFIPVKGSPAGLGQKVKDFPVKRNKDRVWLTWVGADACLDILRKRYLKERPDDKSIPSGFCFWPAGQGYDKEYFKQLLADRKTRKKTSKGYVSSWEPPEGVPNDSSDARRYAFAAVRILQDEFHLDLSVKSIVTSAKKAGEEVYKRIRERRQKRSNG